jgi:hypothetical protein
MPKRPPFLAVPSNISNIPTNKKAKILKECHLLVFKNSKPIDLAEVFHRYFVLRQPTYVADGTSQCSSGRARSIEDCYMLCRSYFPKISYIKLQARVESLYGQFLTHSFCSTVEREVHSPNNVAISLEQIRTFLEKSGNNLVVKEK